LSSGKSEREGWTTDSEQKKVKGVKNNAVEASFWGCDVGDDAEWDDAGIEGEHRG